MPETIGLVILGAIDAAGVTGAATAATFTFGATGVSLATVVGSAALIGGTIGLQSYLNSQNAVKPQDGQQTVRQAIPVRRRSYGRVKVGGAIQFSEARNGVRCQLLALNQGKIAGFVEHWLDQNSVAINPDNHVVSGIYGNYALIDTSLGTDDDDANSRLVTQFSDVWTTAHRARGIATAMLQLGQPESKNYTKVYPGARLPEYRGVIDSAELWNPAATGRANKDNKLAWSFSENSVLQILDFHRHADGLGLGYLDDVLITQAALDEDWATAAAICDEAIALKGGGTEPRYRCSGNYPLNQAPKDTLAAMLATCDGQTYQRSDGAMGIRVGKMIAPTVTIADADILSYDGMRRGPGDSLIPVNQITAKYTSRDHDYQLTDAQAWRDEDEISATGREESRDADFSWVPSHSQTRRLSKLAFARARPDWSGKIVTSLAGLVAYNERYIRLVIAELAIDDFFEIAQFTIDLATMTCTITVSEIRADVFDWDPDTEEGTPPLIPDEATDDHIYAPGELSTEVTGHVITAHWDASERNDTETIAQYSVHGSENWFDMAIDPETPTTAVVNSLAAGYYDVRVYFKVGTRGGDIAGVPNIHIT